MELSTRGGLCITSLADRCELNESLKEGGRISTEGRQHNRLRSVLVVGEIALWITLLLGAGLLLRSFVGLLQVEPGYEPEHVFTAQLPLLHPKYRSNAGGTVAEQLSTQHSQDPQGLFVRQLLERLDSLPGVQSAAASWIPIEGGRDRFEAAFQIEGRPTVEAGSLSHLTVSRMSFVTNNYFKTMGIPILKGRDFTRQDLSPDAPAVRIGSESFVRKCFPNENPIGKRIRFGKGWGEMKITPGVFAKTGLRYDFGRYNEVVSGIEIGISAEYYSGNIPIMLYQKDKQFFYQGHIAFMFGRRK